MALIQVITGATPTTAAQPTVVTSTAVKTLLQVASTVKPFRIVEWGVSFDGYAAAQPIQVELLETDVNAIGTAKTCSGLVKLDGDALNLSDPATVLNLATSYTMFNSTAEGSITATRVFDAQLIAPTNQYIKQFPLGREPVVQAGKFLRVRVTALASVNAYGYVTVDV